MGESLFAPPSEVSEGWSTKEDLCRFRLRSYLGLNFVWLAVKEIVF